MPNPYQLEKWYPFQLTDQNGENPKQFEAAYPKRGEMRIRKHRKENKYDRFRFNKKGELIHEGVYTFES